MNTLIVYKKLFNKQQYHEVFFEINTNTFCSQRM